MGKLVGITWKHVDYDEAVAYLESLVGDRVGVSVQLASGVPFGWMQGELGDGDDPSVFEEGARTFSIGRDAQITLPRVWFAGAGINRREKGRIAVAVGLGGEVKYEIAPA